MRTWLRGFSFVFLLVAGLSLAGPAASQTGVGSQASFYRDLAKQDHAHASEADRRAHEFKDMAAKARARAASSSGVLRDTWEQNAASDDAKAKRLNDEATDWEHKAADLELKAQQAETQAAPAGTASESVSGSGPNVPLGGLEAPPAQASATPAAASQPSSAPVAQSPTGGGGPNVPLGPREGNPPAQTAAQPSPEGSIAATSSCPQASSTEAITTDQITGTWTDTATGKAIQIRSPWEGAIVLRGTHQWEGTYNDGKLKASRYPTLNEMGSTPPGLAREQVEGKVKWELELDAKYDCGAPVLEGKWYPGEFKWSSRVDQNSSGPPRVTVSDFGRGAPIQVKFTQPPPAIARVIVLEDQDTVGGGVPKFPYPFQPGVSLSSARTLFICGRGLPKNWRRKINIEGDSNLHVEYTPVAIWRDPTSEGPYNNDLFAKGFTEMTRELDPVFASQVRALDAMLVKVNLREGVVPGIKEFRLNGLNGAWTLQFGDQRAMLSFARDVTIDSEDTMLEDVFLPERIFLELRTIAPFPIDSIPLRLWVNDKEVHWGGAPVLAAVRDSQTPTLYRTQYIELVENGSPPSSPEQGVFYLPSKPGDVIYARLDDPNLLWPSPAVPRVRVRRTPAELGMTWKEALTRAAQADNINPPVSNWSELSGQRATEIGNYIVTEIAVKLLRSSAVIGLPAGANLSRGTVPGQRTVPVTVGDHAAMLLLREELVKQLEQKKKELKDKIGTLGVRGYRELINVAPWDEQFQWRYLQVSGAGSPWHMLRSMIDTYAPDMIANLADADLPSWSLPYAISDNYLKRKFGDNKEAADRYAQQAVQEGLDQYVRAVDYAIKKIKAPSGTQKFARKALSYLPPLPGFLIPDLGLPDEDVEGLLNLLGLWYAPLAPHIAPRLMRLSDVDNRHLWISELAGRYIVANLNTVAQAVQAQQDYSKLDSQEAMLFASMAVTPFAAGEGLLCSAISWGADCTFLGISLATDVPEYLQQREDFRVALGSSIVLGTSRLKEEELKRTEWFSVLSNVGMNAAGAAISTAHLVGMIRTNLIISSVESGGLKGLMKLPSADQAAFRRYVTEAKVVEEAGDAKMLTESHRRASKAADKVIDELGIKPPPEKLKLRIEATGEAAASARAERPKIDLEEANGGTVFGRCHSPCTVSYDDPNEGGAVPNTMPQPDSAWRTKYKDKSRVLRIGEKVGTGGYATVYELKFGKYPMIPGCENGCVVKAYLTKYEYVPHTTGRSVIEASDRGAKLLGDDIPHKKIIAIEPDAPTPYLIQERLQPGEQHWEARITVTDPKTGEPVLVNGEKQTKTNLQAYAIFHADPDLQRAAVELCYKIAKKGLIWEDAHLGNMYFFKDPNTNKWVAGVLDSDRIIPFSERTGAVGAWIGATEASLMLDGDKPSKMKCRSLYKSKQNAIKFSWSFFQKNPGPYFPDAVFFMEKTLEYKGWLRFDIGNEKWTQGLLDPDIVKEKFPDMFNKSRLAPLPLTKPFWPLEGVRLTLPPLIPGADQRLASIGGYFEHERRAHTDVFRKAA